MIDRRFAEGSSRSLGFGRRAGGAAAFEALFRIDRDRAAPEWSRSNLALTAESYLRARIVVEHVLASDLTASLAPLTARYA